MRTVRGVEHEILGSGVSLTVQDVASGMPAYPPKVSLVVIDELFDAVSGGKMSWPSR